MPFIASKGRAIWQGGCPNEILQSLQLWSNWMEATHPRGGGLPMKLKGNNDKIESWKQNCSKKETIFRQSHMKQHNNETKREQNKLPCTSLVVRYDQICC